MNNAGTAGVRVLVPLTFRKFVTETLNNTSRNFGVTLARRPGGQDPVVDKIQ
jgi:hypothetical protein